MTREFEVTAALLNFRAHGDEVDLGNSFKIMRFTSSDRNMLLELPIWDHLRFSSDLIGVARLNEAKYRLSQTYAIDESEYQANFAPYKDFPLLIRALRLERFGDIGISTVVVLDKSVSYEGKSIEDIATEDLPLVASLTDYGCRRYGSPYVFFPEYVPNLMILMDKLRAVELKGDINTALRYFDQEYTRDLPEDRIIDMTIVLESTLLFGERQQELRYRLALRGATLLVSSSQPTYTKSMLTALYDIRSNIVHNGHNFTHESNIKELRKVDRHGNPEQFLRDCQSIVRSVLRALIWRISAGNSLRQVITLLDDQIISGIDRLREP